MNAPGNIALAAVALAELEASRGVREHGGMNRGEDVERYLYAVGLPPGQPWCAAFTRWCLERAASNPQLPDAYPDSGWCPAVQAWAVKRDLWIPVVGLKERSGPDAPMRGDLILFHFPAKNRVAHIGFARAPVEKGVVASVEGNTGPDIGAVNREGDGVYFKTRALTAIGLNGGFVRLPW